ncbi:hypothetical protein HGD86_07640 [Alteromonadaceae bacterium A_SAG5]|nr:hypothetical protein [Alteromonas sp.]NKX19032.1 hypothetical protein [Alteromonadaceae bacterium A_SAG5]NKX19597.1 hypothetical protein [Alteromonadaceae bacterium A_SAG8]NKX36001.1 hypothetical protein [Alteromonadaceae bacterium A_SAG3]NKX69867.1 hypothetical protein [Alteromonadaceae bacterium A_SAG7]
MADSRETKTFGEMLEILRGKDPKQAREDALFSERIHNQSLKYKNTSPSSWPDKTIVKAEVIWKRPILFNHINT